MPPWSDIVRTSASRPRRPPPDAERSLSSSAASTRAAAGEAVGACGAVQEHVVGANVKAVQRMLGHASAGMTLDSDADLFDDD